MRLSTVLWAVVVLFPLSEVGLGYFRRAKTRDSSLQDRGTIWVLWAAILVAVAVAIWASRIPFGQLSFGRPWSTGLALALLLVGLALRWAAIVTLGRLFTVNVAIQDAHRLVESGPYRFVRHPSYSGLLLAFLGLGLAFGSWLSILALVVPIFGAVSCRIAAEERALLAAFASVYGDYCARTKRLVPGLY